MSRWSRLIGSWAAIVVAAIGSRQVIAQAPQNAPRPGAGSRRTPDVARAHAPTPVGDADITFSKATLEKYCLTCHNSRTKTAGLALDALDVVHVAQVPEVWEKVAR